MTHLLGYPLALLIAAGLVLAFFTKGKGKLLSLAPLGLLLAVGAFLRIYALNVKCYWWDEYLTEQRVWFCFGELLRHPMTVRCLLYSLLMKGYGALIAFFKSCNCLTEGYLRLPHALCGTAVIAIFYLIGKKLKNEILGFWLAAFSCVSFFLVYYAREARQYPFLLFFSLLLIHALLLIIDSRRKGGSSLVPFVYYALAGCLGMHVHQGFWLLCAASSLFLGFYLLLGRSVGCRLKAEWKMTVLEILLLGLPLAAVFHNIALLLDKGLDSKIITAQKIVPQISWNFLKELHQELWQGFAFADKATLLFAVAAIILLLQKKWRLVALYLLFAIAFAFFALTRMGLFKETFKVKYVTFIWPLELLLGSLALFNCLEILVDFFGGRKLVKVLAALVLVLAGFWAMAPCGGKLAYCYEPRDSFRQIIPLLGEKDIMSVDNFLSYGQGHAALLYYKRLLGAKWSVFTLESFITATHYKGGSVGYLLPDGNYDNQVARRLNDTEGMYIYRLIPELKPSVLDHLAHLTCQAFKKEGNNLDLYNSIEKRLRPLDDGHLRNACFSESLAGWEFALPPKEGATVGHGIDHGQNCLVVTNASKETVILFQEIPLQEGDYVLSGRAFSNKIGCYLSLSGSGTAQLFLNENRKLADFLDLEPRHFTEGSNRLAIYVEHGGIIHLTDLRLVKLPNARMSEILSTQYNARQPK